MHSLGLLRAQQGVFEMQIGAQCDLDDGRGYHDVAAGWSVMNWLAILDQAGKESYQ